MRVRHANITMNKHRVARTPMSSATTAVKQLQHAYKITHHGTGLCVGGGGGFATSELMGTMGEAVEKRWEGRASVVFVIIYVSGWTLNLCCMPHVFVIVYCALVQVYLDNVFRA